MLYRQEKYFFQKIAFKISKYFRKSFLNILIILYSTAVKTNIDKNIFIGKPTTKRLNWGIVFMSIPKIMSESRDRAMIGKAKISPTLNIEATPVIR